jgi:hypothetical protein
MGSWRGIRLILLVGADLWLVVTLITAVALGEREADRAPYWIVVAVIALILFVCIRWTIRAARSIRTGP